MLLQVFFYNWRIFRSKRLKSQSILVNYDILSFVEMWLSHKDIFISSRFIEFRKDRTDLKGGEIQLFICKNVTFRQITNITSLDILIELWEVEHFLNYIQL